MSEIIEKQPGGNGDNDLVRVRQKTANAPDVTVSRAYAESLGEQVEILKDVPAVNAQGIALDPSPKSATKNSAS